MTMEDKIDGHKSFITDQSMEDYILFYNTIDDETSKLMKVLRDKFPKDRMRIFYLIYH